MILNFKILYFYLLPFQNYAELQLILLIVSLLEYMDECPKSELQYGHTIGQYGHTVGQYGHIVGQYGHTIGQYGHIVGQYGHTIGQYGHIVGQYGHTIGHKDVQLTLPELSIALEQR